MKDIQGYGRGKCNSYSECKEYRAPPGEDDDKPKILRFE